MAKTAQKPTCVTCGVLITRETNPNGPIEFARGPFHEHCFEAHEICLDRFAAFAIREARDRLRRLKAAKRSRERSRRP